MRNGSPMLVACLLVCVSTGGLVGQHVDSSTHANCLQQMHIQRQPHESLNEAQLATLQQQLACTKHKHAQGWGERGHPVGGGVATACTTWCLTDWPHPSSP